MPDRSGEGDNADERWFVFVCTKNGDALKVGYTAEEYADEPCPCGASLRAVEVAPIGGDDV